MIQGLIFKGLLRLVLVFTGLFLIGTSVWSDQMFGDVSFEQLVYHVQFGANGLMDADPKSLRLFALLAIGLPLIGALALTALWALAPRRWLALPVSGPGRLAAMIGRQAHWVALLAGIAYFFLTFNFGDYLHTYFGEDVFSGAYVDPRQVQLATPARPKSLVLIYVESMENSYQDKALFGRDLLAPLTALQRHYASFGSYEQMPGTNWTMAGILATQCGIPLKILKVPLPGQSGLRMRRFVPHAVCLGDILKAHGYENVFMNGPDLEFAGVGIFLRQHGYDRIYGRSEWLAAGEDRRKMKEWGLRDDRLLANAKAELTRLVAAGRPFNLTVLTVDTHGPEGILSDECRRRDAKDFSGIVSCTAAQVAEFIQFIEAQGWLDRLSVVVQGDHLAMENPLSDQLESNAGRRIFNLIVSQPVQLTSTERISHFDLFPTILDVLGYRPENGRLGLGYCALQSCAQPAPPASRLARFQTGILNRSPVYMGLWTGTP